MNYVFMHILLVCICIFTCNLLQFFFRTGATDSRIARRICNTTEQGETVAEISFREICQISHQHHSVCFIVGYTL